MGSVAPFFGAYRGEGRIAAGVELNRTEGVMMLGAKRAVFISLIEILYRERAPTVPGRIYCPKPLLAINERNPPYSA